MGDTGVLATFVTLFLVIAPVGLAPLFVVLTEGMERARQRAIAVRSCLIALAILTLFGLFGTSVLRLMGISLPAFRIAGGLLLFLIAIEMLFGQRSRRRKEQAEEDDDDPSVFPLATPLIAGPGAIAAMILLSTKDGAGWGELLQAHVTMAAVIGLVLTMFLLAGPIRSALGQTGIVVVTRLLGMLLAALSVQFVIDGLVTLSVIAPPVAR